MEISAEPDYKLPIITKKSELANSLTAVETAYLLQDSVILILASQSQESLHAQAINREASSRW